MTSFSTFLSLQTLTVGLLPEWLNPINLIQALGPWAVVGVLAIVFIETGLLVGFFLPGDSLLFTAGMFTASGVIDINIFLLCLLIFIAAFAGDQVGYLIGRKAGPAIFNRPDSLLFSRQNVDRAHEFFEKYGGRSVVLARFVPIVRTFTPVVAGVAKMDYRHFVGFNLLGALLWGVGVTLLGYWLGQFTWVGENIDKIFIGIVLVSVLPIVFELFKGWRTKKAQA